MSYCADCVCYERISNSEVFYVNLVFCFAILC